MIIESLEREVVSQHHVGTFGVQSPIRMLDEGHSAQHRPRRLCRNAFAQFRIGHKVPGQGLRQRDQFKSVGDRHRTQRCESAVVAHRQRTVTGDLDGCHLREHISDVMSGGHHARPKRRLRWTYSSQAAQRSRRS